METDIDIFDAIQFIECCLEIFHDESEERQQNIKNLLRFLKMVTQDDIDKIIRNAPKNKGDRL